MYVYITNVGFFLDQMLWAREISMVYSIQIYRYKYHALESYRNFLPQSLHATITLFKLDSGVSFYTWLVQVWWNQPRYLCTLCCFGQRGFGVCLHLSRQIPTSLVLESLAFESEVLKETRNGPPSRRCPSSCSSTLVWISRWTSNCYISGMGQECLCKPLLLGYRLNRCWFIWMLISAFSIRWQLAFSPIIV